MTPSRLIPLASVLVMMLAPAARAAHTPAEWYEPGPEDADGNRVDDALEGLPGGQAVDVWVGFLDDCQPPARVAEIAALGGTISYVSPVVASVAVRDLPAGAASIIAGWPEVGRVWAMEDATYFTAVSGESMAAHSGFYSATTAEDMGITGAGITICIIDSGIDDLLHQDLPTAVGGIFVDVVGGQVTVQSGNPTDTPGIGHGTQMAGCALGRGNASGSALGIAPGAELFDARATDAAGALTFGQIQACIDWVTQFGQSVTPPIRVVNLSVGSNTLSAGTPITASVEACFQAGYVMVAGAGNHDSCPVTATGQPAGIGSIAVAPNAITVAGASHEGTADRSDDMISAISRRGPGIGPNPKPDVTAYAGTCNPDCPDGGCAGGASFPIVTTRAGSTSSYVSVIGTSAATAMVSGAAALLLESNPTMSPGAMRQQMILDAEDFGAPNWDPEWGFGLVDLRPSFSAPQGMCDLEVQSVQYSPTPAQCFQPVTVTVTVRNVGATTVPAYAVNFRRWYFGPNGAPPVLYDIAPTLDVLTPLPPLTSRTHTATWTPGISDPLPLSAHSCFWGFVSSSCDTNPANDRRNVNATIVGVQGSQCIGPGGPPPADVVFTVGHPYPFGIEENLVLTNGDPAAWQVEMEVEGQVAADQIPVWVDMAECPVRGTVRALPLGDGTSGAVQVDLSAFSKEFGFLGDMQVAFVDPSGWDDRFDGYPLGPLVGLGGWEPWNGDPAVADAEIVGAPARSEPHAVAIDGVDDVVHRFRGRTFGQWEFTLYQFVPGPFLDTQYVVLLNRYDADGDHNWSLQLAMDGANGQIYDLNTGDTAPLVFDDWARIRVRIDMDADVQQVFYNGALLVEKSWTDGVTGDGALDVAAVNLYAGEGTTPVFYDDLTLMPAIFETPCPADLDDDGTVGFGDLLRILSNWGPCEGPCADDLDKNGAVDFGDLLQVLSAWGPCGE